MKKIIQLTVFLLVTWSSHAQCPVGDVVLTSQTEVNAFGTTYAGCTVIDGSLQIGTTDVPGTDISDLSPLSAITTITSGLTISHNLQLTDLDDLENLTSIGTTLRIEYNPSLISLAGLSDMIPVQSAFTVNIHHNETLPSLVGLEGITSADMLLISYNDALVNMEGLSNLTNASGLNAYGNLAMTSFQGLESLTTLSQGFSIGDNSSLINFSGLDNLTSAGGLFVVQNNHALENLVGLGSLSSVENFLIGTNNALSSLEGLPDGLSITGMLLLSQNPMLGMCAVKPICDFVANGTIMQIENNSTGCNNATEVAEACAALPVTLVSFTAKPEGNTALLSWITIEETGSDYFEVQVSADLKNWRSLGKIQTHGDSNQKQEYSFTDNGPGLQTGFYRLRMVDLDGTFTYSPVRSLVFDSPDVILYPNPVADVLFLKGEDLVNVERVDLTDGNGNIILASVTITDEGLSLRNVHAGLYSLRVYHRDGSMHTFKVLKN